MRLDRVWIEQHIPHKGSMCLLDTVLHWDAERISCRSMSHQRTDNPLRSQDRLGAACGAEYALQAMAVHGALLTPTGAAVEPLGYLVSLQALSLHVARLDDIDADLIATADRISADSRTAIYTFTVAGGEKLLLSGRATLIHDGAVTRPASQSSNP